MTPNILMVLSTQSSLPPFCYGSNFSPLLSHRWQINTPSSQEKPSPNFCSIVLIAKGRILWSPMVVEDLLNQTTTNRWAISLLKSILKEQFVLCRLNYNLFSIRTTKITKRPMVSMRSPIPPQLNLDKVHLWPCLHYCHLQPIIQMVMVA